jgi:hypothetical protein
MCNALTPEKTADGMVYSSTAEGYLALTPSMA